VPIYEEESMIKIANAPCSWGVLEFDLEGKAAGYAQVLDEIKATGYAGTELGDWGFMPTDPILLGEELRMRNLEMLGAFVPVNFSNPVNLAARTKSAIRIAKLLATVSIAPFIILSDANGKNPVRTQNAGRITPEQGLTDEQWEAFAAAVEHVARGVRDVTGVRCVFHHHCAGFVETPAEIAKLLCLSSSLRGICGNPCRNSKTAQPDEPGIARAVLRHRTLCFRRRKCCGGHSQTCQPHLALSL
jgi:inosose dehydratase